MQEYINYFNNLVIVFSILLPVFYLISFNGQSRAYKVFTFYLIFIAIIQALLYYFAREKVNNIFLFGFYFIGQFIFLSVFYYLLIRKRWVYYIMGGTLVLLILQYGADPSLIYGYNTYGVTLTQSIIVIYALLYYYRSLAGSARFLYINTGVFLYFVSSILFFASGNLILSLDLSLELQRLIGTVNDVLYFIFVILIFLEWYRNYRPSIVNKA
jgi:hypothetical protein